jgi:hypothetical protein
MRQSDVRAECVAGRCILVRRHVSSGSE